MNYGTQLNKQIIKALSLIRHPLAYTAVDRLIEVLSLSNLDPYFVDEAARGLGVLAEGKGKGKGKESSHLTAKVRSYLRWSHLHQILWCWRFVDGQLLHAQKMWNYVLPKLVEGDKEASGQSPGLGLLPSVKLTGQEKADSRISWLFRLCYPWFPPHSAYLTCQRYVPSYTWRLDPHETQLIGRSSRLYCVHYLYPIHLSV